MAKEFVTYSYVFNPSAKTIDLSSIPNFDIKLLANITNLTTGNTHIYVAGAETGLGYSSLAGSVITLQYDTTSMNSTDKLLIQYNIPSTLKLVNSDGVYVDSKATENGAFAVGNGMKKFRDGFSTGAPDTNEWDASFVNQGGTIVNQGGNSVGSSYLRISMCPFTADSEYTLLSKTSFKLPNRLIFGYSASQRFLGQELEISLVGINSTTGAIQTYTSSKVGTLISGSIPVASNVATINFSSAHPFKGGDRVILINNSDTRMNVGPVLVTVITSLQITVPLTIANGTYTAGGSVRYADIFSLASNAAGLITENATATNATFSVVRNASTPRMLNSTISTTVATQSNTSPYSDAFNSANINELITSMQEVFYSSKSPDALVAPGASGRWSQGIPDEEVDYKIRVRAKNLTNITKPIARITAISKTGTTTATVTTDVAHNLTTSSYVLITGVRDIANFPNISTPTVVASIISSTQFTIVIGAAVTASSAGGIVILSNGSTTQTGVSGLSVQSIARSNNILTITMNTTATGALPGEYWQLHGCDATSMGLYDGAYKILRMTGTTYEVESIGANFTSINCGGAFFKRTDFRIHFIQQLEYTRLITEMYNQNGTSDLSRSLPTNVVNTVPVSGTLTGVTTVSTVTAVTTVGTVTSGNDSVPTLVADVASAALTTTTTTAAFTPTFGSYYIVNIPVTAVSGTNPTLDVVIQESDDTGTNWYDVYHFPRITATGAYRSSLMPYRGNRVRYVQTVGGSTPSFTRGINRLQATGQVTQTFQVYDRAFAINTPGSSSIVQLVRNCSTYNVVVSFSSTGASPTLQLEGSIDNINWYTIGNSYTPTTGVGVTSSVQYTNQSNEFIRLRVPVGSTAGGATINYVALRSF